jgi:rhodanese-related sulfurtransferase
MAGRFHDHMPFGASIAVKRGVWRTCACVTCQKLLAADAGGRLDADGTAAAGQEDDLQRAVAAMLDARLPDDAVYTAIASGGKRSKATAGRLRAQGVRPGAPDIVVVAPGANVGLGATLWIELKTDAGRLSADQRRWGEALREVRGCFHGVARSVAEVVALLERVGVELKPEPAARKRAA